MRCHGATRSVMPSLSRHLQRFLHALCLVGKTKHILSFCSKKREFADTPYFQESQNRSVELHIYAAELPKTAYLCKNPYIYAERNGDSERAASISLASRNYPAREPALCGS